MFKAPILRYPYRSLIVTFIDPFYRNPILMIKALIVLMRRLLPAAICVCFTSRAGAIRSREDMQEHLGQSQM